MRPRTLVALLVAVGIVFTSTASAAQWTTETDPINFSQLSSLPFGARSFWLQPWRSSLTTRPATALANSIGVNFNVYSQEAGATARLLHASGVTRARVEIPWNVMSYTDPTQIANPSASVTPYITAMRDNGIRPLILLNANSGGPGPALFLNLTLAAPAAAGARTVELAPASVGQVIPGRTGINITGTAAKFLITSVTPTGLANLSQPLTSALPAGPVASATLRFAPFSPPLLANGSPNPRFTQTMAGWLAYVQSVCSYVKSVYGSDNFDVEVWNELGFGSAFLFENAYYNPVPDPGAQGDVAQALLAQTINMLHNPANGLSDVKVGDGFANQTPWVSGATVPAGTDAIDKHPYSGDFSYPGTAPDGSGIKPINAVGTLGGTYSTSTGFQDAFQPSFRVFMPEYFLTGLQTETLMRDLSPTQNLVYGTPHGATTHPAGSAPPAMWITEDGMDAGAAEGDGMPAADVPEMQAKAALRFYNSFASEGVQAIDLYAAKGAADYGLIPQSFFAAADQSPTSTPTSLGGLPMQAIGRMTSTLSGAQSIADPRQLSLEAIASNSDDEQFAGNGTLTAPPLYNRDVLAFFPFQVSQNKFVASVYVMSRDLTHYYTSTPAAGSTPYDMPPEQFRLTIGNVDGARATVSLTDPLTGAQAPAAIVNRSADSVVVQVAATDSPRMLTIDDSSSNPTATLGRVKISARTPARAPGA